MHLAEIYTMFIKQFFFTCHILFVQVQYFTFFLWAVASCCVTSQVSQYHIGKCYNNSCLICNRNRINLATKSVITSNVIQDSILLHLNDFLTHWNSWDGLKFADVTTDLVYYQSEWYAFLTILVHYGDFNKGLNCLNCCFQNMFWNLVISFTPLSGWPEHCAILLWEH